MKYLKHLRYRLIHKWYVFLEMCKIGRPLLGLIHDISSFCPSEFLAYSEYFYGKSAGNRSKKVYNSTHNSGDKFDRAVFLHFARNKHHWQYWIMPLEIDIEEDEEYDKCIALEIPEKYVEEMICDWKGAAKAKKNKNTIQQWYIEYCYKFNLHYITRKLIEQKLGIN